MSKYIDCCPPTCPNAKCRGTGSCVESLPTVESPTLVPALPRTLIGKLRGRGGRTADVSLVEASCAKANTKIRSSTILEMT